jgi:hypothetical protein
LVARFITSVGVHGGEQRVAVGRRLGDHLRGDDRVGAGPVLDDDRLAEIFAQPLPDHAGENVGRPAGRERHHDADRPLGIARRRIGGLRAGRRDAGQHGHGTHGEHAGVRRPASPHDSPP